VLFKPGAPDGMWKVTLTDADANANQSYDAWAEGDGVYFSTFVDHDSHLVASPGTARGAITVGAFVTRSATQTIGAPAPFTSPGPTADGRQKPDIGAPGYYLYSSRSADVADANFGTIGTGANAPADSAHYTGLAGTSMATPVTTGSVALLIQSSPTLSADEIKNALTTYAVKDIYTGSAAWGPRLGFGKLNIANSIDKTGGGFQKYSISGRMADPDGSGVFDLQIFLSGSSSAMARTDSDGNFSFTNLSGGGNYTVAPSQQSSMTFSPQSFTFNNLNANQTANFLRTTTVSYSVHGRLVDQNGNGLPGLRVEFPGASTVNGLPILPAQTDINGYYAADLPKGQNFQVTPTSQYHTFTPTSVAIANLSGNKVLDFVATALPVAINGQVTDGTKGLAGVSVTILENGAPQSTTVLTDANGFYTLAGAGTGQLYTITPSKTGYVFEPASQTLYIYPFSQPRVFVGSNNPIDNTSFFVTQHYRDFLNREPDADGLSYWTNQILVCGASSSCIDAKRVNTSGAFFLSIEFQETGYLVERIYKSAYGDFDGTSVIGGSHQIKVPIVKFNEFLADTQQIGKDVAVGVGNWQTQLENNKIAFTQDFVTRSRFVSAYPTAMTPAEFVDKLFLKAVVTPSAGERSSIINEFGGAGNTTDIAARARALRRVAENAVLAQTEMNKAFVLMQYFGYLRRDPNAAPDSDHTGYDFWLTKLTQFNGNFTNAEMVKAFIVSIEYRKRFAP
jgi:hypothetical protein